MAKSQKNPLPYGRAERFITGFLNLAAYLLKHAGKIIYLIASGIRYIIWKPAQKRGFKRYALLHRISDLTLIAIITGLLVVTNYWFSNDQTSSGLWAMTSIILTIIICWMLTIMMMGRIAKLHEYDQSMGGLITQNERRFQDGYLEDALSAYMIMFIGWVCTTVLMTKMAVSLFSDMDMTIFEVALALTLNYLPETLGDSISSNLYMASPSPESFTSPLPIASYLIGFMTSSMAATGLIGWLKVRKKVLGSVKKLLSKKDLPDEQILALVTALAGAPPYAKSKILNIALDRTELRWRRKRAMDVACVLRIANFPPIFIGNLHREKDDGLKYLGLDILTKIVQDPKSSLNYNDLDKKLRYQMTNRKRKHTPGVLRKLAKLQGQIQKQ